MRLWALPKILAQVKSLFDGAKTDKKTHLLYRLKDYKI